LLVTKNQQVLNFNYKVSTGNKIGFINFRGELFYECLLDSATDFVNGRAFVKKDNKWGVINELGQSVINIEFDSISYKTNNNNILILTKQKATCIIDINGKEIDDPMGIYH
jgi:hypothetical protein